LPFASNAAQKSWTRSERIALLRDDAFVPELARVLEHGGAVGRLDVLDYLDAVVRAAQRTR